jgi:hypothetical protein
MPAGRPRKHDAAKVKRVSLVTTTTRANTLDIAAEYMRVHTAVDADRNALINAAIDAWVASHATLVEQAVTWWKKGKKPPKEG